MASMTRWQKQAWLFAAVAALISVLSIEGLYRSAAVVRMEYLYTDLWHRFAQVRVEPAHTALVMLDDPTLNERPDEPLAFWTPHFAQAAATLRQAGARLVVIDFLFSGSPERWIKQLGLMGKDASRNYDQPFRKEINQGGVLLAGFRVGDGDSIDDFVLPSPDYLLALPELDLTGHVGLANLRSDSDGAVRRFAMTEAGQFARSESLPHLAFAPLAAVRATQQQITAEQWVFGKRTLDLVQELPIAFAGPPGTFHPLSFRKLLAADALSDPDVKALAGKVVIIGAGYAGMNDVHPTPYSTSLGGANTLMTGPEIQANIAETLLSGRFVEPLSASWRVALFLAVLGALALVCMRLPPWRAVIVVIFAAQVAIVFGYLLFKRDIIVPVAHLQLGMVLVLAFLSLWRLTREERERNRLGTVFGRYVSPQLMEALQSSSELPELGGQISTVTVLFSDIRNFTTMSEKLTAREVVEMLNTYFARACEVLQAEGAIIDKFIGDAIMAEFGAPLAQPDHALRAVRASVALRAVAVDFQRWMSERFAGRDLPAFDIGIGLHSGEVVMGNIGSPTHMEYTAIGDTVNVASRLEGKTKETGCHILASQATIGFAGGSVRVGQVHQLDVKGRHEPVPACEVLGFNS
jgi:adenylate cyclase